MVLLSLEFSGNWEKQKDKIMSSSYQFMFSSYHLIALCSCLFDHLLLPKVPFSSMQFFLSDHGPVCSPSSPWSQISTSVLPSSHQSWSPINIFLWETSWTSDSEKEQTRQKESWVYFEFGGGSWKEIRFLSFTGDLICFGCHPIFSIGLQVTIGSTQLTILGMLKSPW